MRHRVMRHALQAPAWVFITWVVGHLLLVGTDAAVVRSNMLTMVEVESKRLHAGFDLLLVVVLAVIVYVATRRRLGPEAIPVSVGSAAGATLLALVMAYYVRLSLLGRLPSWLGMRAYAYDVVVFCAIVSAVLLAMSLLFRGTTGGRPQTS